MESHFLPDFVNLSQRFCERFSVRNAILYLTQSRPLGILASLFCYQNLHSGQLEGQKPLNLMFFKEQYLVR